MNLNKVKFGQTQLGETVGDVKLPEWARDDPFYYTCVLRRMIESDYVSSAIHLWIDYIFGFKQQGKEAVQNVNIFPFYTYANKLSLDIRDPKQNSEEKQDTIAAIVRAYNYGQTPLMLF